LADAGRADVLVTGDDDLLALRGQRNVNLDAGCLAFNLQATRRWPHLRLRENEGTVEARGTLTLGNDALRVNKFIKATLQTTATDRASELVLKGINADSLWILGDDPRDVFDGGFWQFFWHDF